MAEQDVVYRSQVRIERLRGPMRRAWVPAREEPITFGVHSEVAEHYRVDPDAYPPDATTIDYVVAAAAGWLTGTLGGALEARGIDASNGKLTSTAVGEVEKDGKVLVLKRIHVTYALQGVTDEQMEAADRAHEHHADYCPVARSIKDSIAISTELTLG